MKVSRSEELIRIENLTPGVRHRKLTSTPEQYGEFFKTEIARWGKVIREADIASIKTLSTRHIYRTYFLKGGRR